MARCIARRMRSGVLVGPGTKRKLRPAMRGPSVKEGSQSGRRVAPADVTTVEVAVRRAIFYASSPCIALCAFFHKPELLPTPDRPAPRDAPPASSSTDLYTVATAAVAPGPALARRLRACRPGRPVRLIALGKAALPMARAAVEALAARGAAPAGGLIVAPADAPGTPSRAPRRRRRPPRARAGSLRRRGGAGARPPPSVAPGRRGLGAALRRHHQPARRARSRASTPADLTALYRLLLGSGLDIGAMNLVRKRFSRWGGGRLARGARARPRPRLRRLRRHRRRPRRPSAPAPASPTPPPPPTCGACWSSAGLWDESRQPRAGSSGSRAGEIAETPKPGDQAFARVTLELIASNSLAVEAAAKRAAELGLAPVVMRTPLAGEASAAGASVAATLLEHCGRPAIPQPRPAAGARCSIWGGETTVTLGDAPPGLGGRCQELALAAARALAGAPRASRCWRRAPTGATARPTPPARSWTDAPGTPSRPRAATLPATSPPTTPTTRSTPPARCSARGSPAPT